METVEIINELRDFAEAQEFGTLRNILDEAADRLEELDERVAIMSAEPDAIALLKEQEPVKPEYRQDAWWCPNCGNVLSTIANWSHRYCWYCGRSVKWDE